MLEVARHSREFPKVRCARRTGRHHVQHDRPHRPSLAHQLGLRCSAREWHGRAVVKMGDAPGELPLWRLPLVMLLVSLGGLVLAAATVISLPDYLVQTAWAVFGTGILAAGALAFSESRAEGTGVGNALRRGVGTAWHWLVALWP